MGFLTPAIGTIFWMIVIFLIAFVILKKYAWKPILNGLKEREHSIEKALNSAADARKEVSLLKANQDEIVAEARKEKDEILKEAREMKDQMLTEAKQQAQAEGSKIIEQAQLQIEIERKAAVADIKKEIAELSVQIAGKILEKELAPKEEQDTLINNLLNEIKLN